MALTFSTHPAYPPVVLVTSTALFWLVGTLVARNVPSSAKSQWKFKNISVSLFHSIISGIGSLASFWLEPAMAEDMVFTSNDLAYFVVCFATAYFFYDMLDMVANFWTIETAELVLHHSIVITCFMATIVLQKFVGLTVFGLIVEVNGVFLHIRQLFQLTRTDKDSPLYRANGAINLVTFIPFRIVVVAYMLYWEVYNKELLPFGLWLLVFSCSIVMMSMYILLFYRLVKRDLFSGKQLGKPTQNGTHGSNGNGRHDNGTHGNGTLGNGTHSGSNGLNGGAHSSKAE